MSERLPAELWHKIFQHACVDGGRTGCALSLVSRRLHDLSVGTRLQSVFIVGLERLRLLLHTLERLPEYECRVRFLFIATSHAEEAETRILQMRRSRVRQPRHAAPLSSRFKDKKQQEDWIQEWQTVYPAVLALIAPHVEVLTIRIPQPLLNSVFPANICFPVLRDLTFGQMEEKDQFPCMPLLRRLHVFGHPAKALIHSAIDIQGLQLVRFSDYRAVDEFAVALGETSARTSCLSGPVRSTKLVITPDCPSFRCGNGYFSWAERHRRTRDSLMEHQNNGRFGTITVLKPSRGGYKLDSAVNDWRDVVENGGEGAWGNFEEPVRSPGTASDIRAAQDTTEEAPRSPHGLVRRRDTRGANSDSEPRASSVGFGLGRRQFTMDWFSMGQQENSDEAGQQSSSPSCLPRLQTVHVRHTTLEARSLASDTSFLNLHYSDADSEGEREDTSGESHSSARRVSAAAANLAH
jgi:hypothetical protein